MALSLSQTQSTTAWSVRGGSVADGYQVCGSPIPLLLFFQPGLPCSQSTHGEFIEWSSTYSVHVEGVMSCRYLPSVARHLMVTLGESMVSSGRGIPLHSPSYCIGWAHYSFNQVRLVPLTTAHTVYMVTRQYYKHAACLYTYV